MEKLEEAKLKAKFPNAILGKGSGGHSAFLQKRLAKGVSKDLQFNLSFSLIITKAKLCFKYILHFQ